MNEAHLRRLLHRVLSTEDDEPDFDVAEGLMIRCAEARARGDDPGDAQARLDAHLRQCPESSDIFAALAELVELEIRNALPDSATLLAALRDLLPLPDPAGATPPPRPRGVALLRGEVRQARRFVERLAARFAPVRLLAPMALMVLLVISGLGWWRADREANATARRLLVVESALQQFGGWRSPVGEGLVAHAANTETTGATDTRYRELVETVCHATQLGFARTDIGAWARVAYNPDLPRALVWAGEMPRSPGQTSYRCWLRRPNGERQAVTTLEYLDGEPAWWHIDAADPFGVFESFVMTREPGGEEVLQVALDGR